MKKLFTLFVLLVFAFACKNSETKETTVTDETTTTDVSSGTVQDTMHMHNDTATDHSGHAH